MKILIFEGIATSGKSTIIEKLRAALQADLKVVLASEDETHVPIMEQRSELHVNFFKDLIRRLAADNPDVVLLDRLIMTQAYRARADLEGYSEVEDMLLKYDSLIVYLLVQEAAILDRVMKATEHRNPEWLEYVKTKGDRDQLANYYISQQRGQLKLLEQSRISHKTFDTTNHDYGKVITELTAYCTGGR